MTQKSMADAEAENLSLSEALVWMYAEFPEAGDLLVDAIAKGYADNPDRGEANLDPRTPRTP